MTATEPKPDTALQRLRSLKSYLEGEILGQARAIARACSVFHRGELGLASPGRPKGSLLLVAWHYSFVAALVISLPLAAGPFAWVMLLRHNKPKGYARDRIEQQVSRGHFVRSPR